MATGQPRVIESESITVPISVVIPSFKREKVLIDSINFLNELPIRASEIIVVDQTPEGTHETATTDSLAAFHEKGVIRLITMQPPSITQAMELGLLQAEQEIVLFLDDDIIPDTTLVEAHFKAHQEYGPNTVVNGRVQQPWDSEDENDGFNPFRFYDRRRLTEIAGGNFSVRVDDWKRVGGFDKNFSRVAYRYEKDFAQRFMNGGGTVWLEPDAGIIHLHAKEGGTRSWGDTRRKPKATPDQSVGQFYYIFRHIPRSKWLGEILRYCKAMLFNRTTLKRPWHIPVHAIGLTRGLGSAWQQYRNGPMLYHEP